MSPSSLLAAALLVARVAALPAQGVAGSEVADFAVVDARVFDGERTLERATVVVRGGRIAWVGSGRPAALPRLVVNGRGRTLLPGLIDAHFHSRGREDLLGAALHAGVTTVLDMFGTPLLPRRVEGLRGRADLAESFSSGAGATAPGGHGTQYGYLAPTLQRAEQADAFVAARVEEGSAFLKVIIAPGVGQPRPTLDSATVAALVEAAHRRGLLAVAHVDRARDAAMALRNGVDGLVHVWRDAGPVPEVTALARARGAFVVPTLVVILEAASAGAEARALAADPRLRWLPDSVRAELRQPRWLNTLPDSIARARRGRLGPFRRRLLAAVGDLHRSGVPILAGSDAPNFGMHPVLLHRELELLVQAGLTPTQALRAATAAPADAFRRPDRGRIAVGRRADLLLVDGDPTSDITATRAIVSIWRGGVPVARPAAGAPPE